jgi:hypothetical protein
LSTSASRPSFEGIAEQRRADEQARRAALRREVRVQAHGTLLVAARLEALD